MYQKNSRISHGFMAIVTRFETRLFSSPPKKKKKKKMKEMENRSVEGSHYNYHAQENSGGSLVIFLAEWLV